MDLDLFHTVNGLAGQAAWLDHLLAWLATYLPVVFGLLLAAAWFWPGVRAVRNERQHLVTYAVAAALLGLGLAQVIGHLWFRDRPYVHHAVDLLLTPSPDPSFPSDHAVGGFALAMPFVFARRRLGWLLLALATVLALARVAVGTHYPSDVGGGALIGASSALAVWRGRSWLERPLAICLSLAQRLRLA
jgi:undecaprenyl-diphosphatase